MVPKRPLLSSQGSRSSEEASRPWPTLSRDRSDKKIIQSFARRVSPPPAARKRYENKSQDEPKSELPHNKPAAAAVEAGERTVEDHVTFWSTHLLPAIRVQDDPKTPRIDHAAWLDLYNRNASSLKGCHFVVHQHDHPVAGTHYDLRLQCNPTSSISFAIMYGLPGDPNSRRLNRNATETRVHCLWNHLIETASYTTGSMLIWDAGEYEVLPISGDKEGGDESASDGSAASETEPTKKQSSTEQQKLKRSFQRRKIKLRLHGTRLPQGYTLSLRLTKENYRSEQPKKPSRRRRRRAPGAALLQETESESDKQNSDAGPPRLRRGLSSFSRLASPPESLRQSSTVGDESTSAKDAVAVASDNEDEAIRVNNAYTGATNDIGSIHQRRWYLSVDRTASGFLKRTRTTKAGSTETVWLRRSGNELLSEGVLGAPDGFERFIVGGREKEKSIVTGRLASEILVDEGVEGYIPRGLWNAIDY